MSSTKPWIKPACIIGLIMLVIIIIYLDSLFASYAEFKNTVERADYFERLSGADLHARQCRTNAEYRAKYLHSYQPLTWTEKIKILIHLPTMPRKLDVKYSIVKLRPGVELDHPHTLGRCVMLTDDTINGDLYLQLKAILTHEIVHIYQRYHRRETHQLLSQMGFTFMHSNQDNRHTGLNLASNPDVHDVYYHLQNGQPHSVHLVYLPSGQIGNYLNGMADISVPVFANVQDNHINDIHKPPTEMTQGKPVQFQPDLFQSQPEEIMAELLARYICGTNTIKKNWHNDIAIWLNT